MMISEYDRDWLFIARRLFNNYNGSEKQIIVYLNDIVLFDESSKLSQTITMNTKPFMASIKLIDNPTMQQVGKLFNAKAVEGRFLDIDVDLDDPATIFDTRSVSASRLKTTNKNVKATLDYSTDNKNSRDMRERERNSWKLYESRLGDSSMASHRNQEVGIHGRLYRDAELHCR
jgi:hypothetical protein